MFQLSPAEHCNQMIYMYIYSYISKQAMKIFAQTDGARKFSSTAEAVEKITTELGQKQQHVFRSCNAVG